MNKVVEISLELVLKESSLKAKKIIIIKASSKMVQKTSGKKVIAI